MNNLDYESILGRRTESHYKISPARTELSVGDVFAGSRYWVGESNRRPVSFIQIVRFTPKRAVVIFLPHVILEAFNGGSRRSQDGYERVTVNPLTGAQLAAAAQDRERTALAWVNATTKEDLRTTRRFKKPDITLNVTGVEDTRFRAWDGRPTISS